MKMSQQILENKNKYPKNIDILGANKLESMILTTNPFEAKNQLKIINTLDRMSDIMTKVRNELQS